MSLITFIAPHVAQAAELGSSVKGAAEWVVDIISKGVVPIVVGLALVAVFWNLARYIIKSDNETERERFAGYALWSLIAFFVALSVFGIVKILGNTLLGNPNTAIPQFPTDVQE
jgi:sterol desaturase/sphingolipid hydroxylase (fatty acid hydroxylase superfamily)